MSDKEIQKFKAVHGDKYDYSKVNYINAKTKVIIICREHGEFSQLPNSHKAGHGCPECASKLKGNRKPHESQRGKKFYSEDFVLFIMDDMQDKIDKLEKENLELKDKLFWIEKGDVNGE